MYDAIIIGAGVTGSAIARELAKYQASICVIEREEDVCCGTSKANSAIIHAGFDAEPGSRKAALNVRGNSMMDTLAKELSIPFARNGSLVVCTKSQNRADLAALLEKGKKKRCARSAYSGAGRSSFARTKLKRRRCLRAACAKRRHRLSV